MLEDRRTSDALLVVEGPQTASLWHLVMPRGLHLRLAHETSDWLSVQTRAEPTKSAGIGLQAPTAAQAPRSVALPLRKCTALLEPWVKLPNLL